MKRLHGTLNVTRNRKRRAKPVPVGALQQKPPAELTPAERVVCRATVRSLPSWLLFRADTEVVKGFCRIAVRVDERLQCLMRSAGGPIGG